MPERWERELRKLHEIRSRDDLAARVEEGPRGQEGPPPARRRVVAAVTALAVFAAGAFLLTRAIGPPPDRSGGAAAGGTGATGVTGVHPPLELRLEVADGQPGGALAYGDFRQDGVVEGSTWCDAGGQCTSGIADFAFYPPVSEYLVVPPGAAIEVSGDGLVDATIQLETPEGDRLPGGALHLVPDEDGRYVLAVSASWTIGEEHGDASMFFGVQALSSPTAAPDVLGVDCGFGFPRLDTAVVRIQADGLHLEFRGTEGFTQWTVLTPEDPRTNEASGFGGTFGDDMDVVAAVPPGFWEIGCGTDDRPVEGGDMTVPFEVVDPGQRFVPSPSPAVATTGGTGPSSATGATSVTGTATSAGAATGGSGPSGG